MSPEKNLGDVFGTAAVSGLAGRLTPVATPPPAPAAQEPPAEAPPVPAVAPVAPPVAPSPAPAATPAGPVNQTGTSQVTVYVLPHVPAAIRAAKNGRTNATVVYDAIEACHDRLPALLAARRAASQPARTLFTPQRDRRTGAPQRVPWTFKATPANRATLDRLAATHGATSRSELVSVALEAAHPRSH